MPGIMFASNSISHFPGSIIGAADWSYDENRVPYSIETLELVPVASPPLPASSPTDEWWFHLRNGSTYYDTNEDENIIDIRDNMGNRIFQLSYYDRSGEGYHFRGFPDGVGYTQSNNINKREDWMRTYDVQIKHTALNWEVRVYANELLIHENVVPVSSWENPHQFILGGSANGRTYYSEVIVADGDTRNARLDLLRPVAVGAYNNWDGPVASLSDDDPTTGMTTTAVDQSQSTVLTPYTGANNISNIVTMTTSVRGINSPENIQHLIRMGGVDYLSAQIPVPQSKELQIVDWSQNPATSLPWQAADLATAEFGFRSKA